MKQFILLSVIVSAIFVTSCSKNKTICPDTINYESITIGTQVWMKKNLDVDHYRNGDPIPQVESPAEWAKLTTGAWCYYQNDPAIGKNYGKLYNWYAINDTRGLAPVGWHIPNSAELDMLILFLGGENKAGSKLKEAGTVHWNSPNKDATNESGFSALPGDGRDEEGRFFTGGVINQSGNWWTASEIDNNFATCIYIPSNNFLASRVDSRKRHGFSVRCVKD